MSKTNKPLNLNQLAQEIHENAVAHGWWNEPRSFPEIAALIHSEISEALEAFRDDEPMVNAVCAPGQCDFYDKCDKAPGECKPEGVAVELADAIIRILDYTAAKEIDITAVILAKHEYNKGRPYRNGGKAC
jgi:hypothetical protein